MSPVSSTVLTQRRTENCEKLRDGRFTLKILSLRGWPEIGYPEGGGILSLQVFNTRLCLALGDVV